MAQCAKKLFEHKKMRIAKTYQLEIKKFNDRLSVLLPYGSKPTSNSFRRRLQSLQQKCSIHFKKR